MNTIRHFGMLAGVCAALTAFGASAGEWKPAEDSSTVKFTFIQQGSRYDGRFEEFDATIDFDPKNPAAGSIVGVVQTKSVSTRDFDRDATLQDPDWFDSAKHPEARFESESIEQTADGFVANGNLTLKGKTNPAQINFTWESKGDTAHFIGKMKVNRFDYNVGEGWNDTSFVGQDVDVEIDLQLTQ